MSENPGFGFAPFKRAPAYQVVSEKIREAILDGRIPAGKLLPTETALAAQFGVTRSTLREAIRLLEQSGLLGRAGRKRLEVRQRGRHCQFAKGDGGGGNGIATTAERRSRHGHGRTDDGHPEGHDEDVGGE